LATAKEIEALKRKLRKQEAAEREQQSSETKLARYAKKSNAGMRKGNRSKAGRRDIFAKGQRAPGSGFSRRG
jgi:hypothetical protein